MSSEEIKQLTDRLEAVLVREKFKEQRIKELEKIIAKKDAELNKLRESSKIPSSLTVTHKFDTDTTKLLVAMGLQINSQPCSKNDLLGKVSLDILEEEMRKYTYALGDENVY